MDKKKYIPLKIFILVFLITISLFKVENASAQSKEGDTTKVIQNREITEETFLNTYYLQEKSYVFYPKFHNGKLPVIFFCHGYGGTDPKFYSNLIEHIVLKGYAVVYTPYPIVPPPTTKTLIESKYKILWKGIEESVSKYGSLMDLSRIGFVGHSFGAGAIPSLAYKAVQDKDLGESGIFLYMMAPWYSYGITQEQLNNYPKNTKLVMEVFSDDTTNDHRMAKDIFENISIPNSEKDFITLFTSSNKGKRLNATHGTPLGGEYNINTTNELDIYGIFKIFDGLADYSFNGSLEGKNVSLGNSSKEQLFMGNWQDGTPIKNLSSTDTPILIRPQAFYDYKWDSGLNPRKHNTIYSDDKDGISYLNLNYSVPTNKEFKITFNSKLNHKSIDNSLISVYDSNGNLIDVNISLGNDSTVLKVTPVRPYSSGSSYTLYVNKGILSSSNSPLKKVYALKFTTSGTFNNKDTLENLSSEMDKQLKLAISENEKNFILYLKSELDAYIADKTHVPNAILIYIRYLALTPTEKDNFIPIQNYILNEYPISINILLTAMGIK